MTYLSRGIHAIKKSCIRYWAENYSYCAAALTFGSLLTLVPLLSVTLAILTKLPFSKIFLGHVQEYVFNLIVPDQGQKVYGYVQTFTQQAAQLPTIQFGFLVFVSILLFFTIEKAFNDIWRVPMRLKGIKAIVMFLGVVIVAPVLVGASLAISSYLFALPLFHDSFIGDHQEMILNAFSLISVWLAFLLLYVIVPCCKVKWRYASVAAVLAAAFFEAAKLIFALYVKLFPTYAILYGALSIIPIFFIWVYLCWIITLFGGLVAYELQHTLELN
ncbi:MAG: YihY family inner membrane protein [Gammaproteobacteria bacterium]